MARLLETAKNSNHNTSLMKAKLLLLVSFLFLGEFGFSQNRNASLQVEFSQSRTNLTFEIGKERFQVNRDVLIIDDLGSGFYPVQIFEMRGNRRVLVYDGGINLARNATTFAFFRNGNFEVFGIEAYQIEEPVIIVERPLAMNNAMFQQLKRTVESESFDSSRVELLESTLRNNFFNSHQIKELMMLVSFDSGRLQFAKSAYTRTVDPENYFIVREALSFSSSKTELTNYINSIPAY